MKCICGGKVELGYCNSRVMRPYLHIGCDGCGRYESQYKIWDLIQRWKARQKAIVQHLYE